MSVPCIWYIELIGTPRLFTLLKNSTSKAWSSWFISRSWFPLEKYSSALTVRSLGFCCRALSRASKAWHTQSAHSHYTVSTISQLNRWRDTESCILKQRHRAGSAKAPFSPHATLNHKRILGGAGGRERRRTVHEVDNAEKKICMSWFQAEQR